MYLPLHLNKIFSLQKPLASNGKGLLLICLFVCWGLLRAETVQGQAHIKQALSTFSKTPGLAHAQWGFACQQANTGKILATHQPDVTLAPASTLKTLTTAAALQILGPAYRVTTRLCYNGNLKDGILHGNLFIIGEGDPTLGSDRGGQKNAAEAVLQAWVKAVKNAGITRVEGSVVGAGNLFPDPQIPDGWVFGDLGNYYGAPVSALNWRENEYKLFFQTGAKGTLATLLYAEPKPDGLVFKSNVTAAGTRDLAYIYPGPGPGQRLVTGTLPPNRKNYDISGSLPDPALACAQELEKALKQVGIITTQPAASVNAFSSEEWQNLAKPEGKTPLLEIYSPPLSEIVNLTNQFSLNLYAETLLKWLAWKKNMAPTTENGAEVLAGFWTKQLGPSAEGMVLTDGSGLSAGNGITPRQLMQVQNTMLKAPNLGRFYLESLSVMGKKGTLADMGKGTPAAGRVYAKSGTLTRVLCYTGIINPGTSNPLVFSIMVNKYTGTHHDMKQAIEKLMVSMASSSK